ncbi:MAG TPA: NitrOD5 domain-containing protein [Nitrososphaera sp.]|jgi:hypothetical protein|nr:NitrOD5 domain-containing protein [Nitrososphaera sp.]
MKQTVVSATERALERAGPHFKTLLTFYLKDKHNAGLEIVYDEPQKFHDAIADLFGVYSCNLLETVIEETLLTGSLPRKIADESSSFKSFVEEIKSGKIKIISLD